VRSAAPAESRIQSSSRQSKHPIALALAFAPIMMLLSFGAKAADAASPAVQTAPMIQFAQSAVTAANSAAGSTCSMPNDGAAGQLKLDDVPRLNRAMDTMAQRSLTMYDAPSASAFARAFGMTVCAMQSGEAGGAASTLYSGMLNSPYIALTKATLESSISGVLNAVRLKPQATLDAIRSNYISSFGTLGIAVNVPAVTSTAAQPTPPTTPPVTAPAATTTPPVMPPPVTPSPVTPAPFTMPPVAPPAGTGNTTTVTVTSTNTQTASSGSAASSGNTNGGGATSGNATNSNSTTTTVDVTSGSVCDRWTPTIKGTAGPDQIAGTEGNDVIFSYGGNDVVHGGGGDDKICTGAGNDQVYGDAGQDLLVGETGNDVLLGGAGDDVLDGGPGAADVDTNDGGDGNDACTTVTIPSTNTNCEGLAKLIGPNGGAITFGSTTMTVPFGLLTASAYAALRRELPGDRITKTELMGTLQFFDLYADWKGPGKTVTISMPFDATGIHQSDMTPAVYLFEDDGSIRVVDNVRLNQDRTRVDFETSTLSGGVPGGCIQRNLFLPTYCQLIERETKPFTDKVVTMKDKIADRDNISLITACGVSAGLALAAPVGEVAVYAACVSGMGAQAVQNGLGTNFAQNRVLDCTAAMISIRGGAVKDAVKCAGGAAQGGGSDLLTSGICKVLDCDRVDRLEQEQRAARAERERAEREARERAPVSQPVPIGPAPTGTNVNPQSGAVSPQGGAVSPQGGAVSPQGGAVSPQGGAVSPQP
jgi:Ca2+-binding RTX toxin-like protein